MRQFPHVCEPNKWTSCVGGHRQKVHSQVRGGEKSKASSNKKVILQLRWNFVYKIVFVSFARVWKWFLMSELKIVVGKGEGEKKLATWHRLFDVSQTHTLDMRRILFYFFFFTQKLLTNSFHVWSFVTYPASVVLRCWCLLFPTKPVAALMYVCVLWSIARWGGCLSRARPPHTICCFFRRSTRHVSHSLYDKVDDAKKPTTTTKMKIFVLLIKPRCCHYLFLGVVALKILLKASEAAVARLSRLSMRTLFHEN